MASKTYPSDIITLAPGRREKLPRRTRGFLDPVLRHSPVFGGGYAVIGSAAVAGTPDVPVQRLICLFDRKTKKVIRSQISRADGVYSFLGVNRGPWTVHAFDHTGEYNAVVADNISGEPM